MICSVCHDEGAIMHGSPLFPTEQPSVHRQCVGQYNRNKIRETITDQQLRHWYLDEHESARTIAAKCAPLGIPVGYNVILRVLADLGILRHGSDAVASQWERDRHQGSSRRDTNRAVMKRLTATLKPWMSDPAKVKIIGQKIAEKKVGARNPVFCEGVHRTHYTEDGRLLFRGSWEANIARVLSACGIAWEYEPRHFALPPGDNNHPRSYTPDFLAAGYWIEVKGYWRSEAREKVQLFRERYPQESLVIIDRSRYLALASIFGREPWWIREKHINPTHGVPEALRDTPFYAWWGRQTNLA